MVTEPQSLDAFGGGRAKKADSKLRFLDRKPERGGNRGDLHDTLPERESDRTKMKEQGLGVGWLREHGQVDYLT